MKPTRNKKNFLNRKKMYRKMSKTNIWEIHARIEPYENVFETMLPHRDQEAWTSMSFNKTETNKLEINRKYVAVAVRVSTEMNKRYTNENFIGNWTKRNTGEKKKKRKNRLGLFLLYNFFLVVAAFLLLFFFVVFLYIFFEPASLCRVRGFRLIFPPLHSIWQTHGTVTMPSNR